MWIRSTGWVSPTLIKKTPALLLGCPSQGLSHQPTSLQVMWPSIIDKEVILCPFNDVNEFFLAFSYCPCKEPTHWKRPSAGKDWRQKEKGAAEQEAVSWHHQLHGQESEQTPGDSGGQRSLACCSPRGHNARHNLATDQPQISSTPLDDSKIFQKSWKSMNSCLLPSILLWGWRGEESAGKQVPFSNQHLHSKARDYNADKIRERWLISKRKSLQKD